MTRAGSLALFLGAGVSRPLGFPLSAEILPRILERLREGTEAGGQTDELRRLLAAFLPALDDPQVEPPLITDVLSLLDQLLEDGHALGPDLGPAALFRLRSLLGRAIAEVLAEPPAAQRERGRALLDRLVDGLLAAPEAPAVITTNYDLAVESRLYGVLAPDEVARRVDFGMSWRAGPDGGLLYGRPPRPDLRFHKLHGSLDWRRCELCGHVTIDLERGPKGGSAAESGKDHRCACGYGPLRHIFVAPSMVRELRDPNLLAVWHAALEALRTADEWIVVGYSLPPEDVAVRSLLLRAWRARRRPPALRVVETAPDASLEARYRLLFPRATFEAGGAEAFLEVVASPLR